MTSQRPYLVRAIHDWITDNGMTPYLLVDANQFGVEVPRAYVDQGKIVLSLSVSAVHGLSLGNDEIRFSARFGGKATQVRIPTRAVLALYAKENGHGMIFPDEEGGAEEPPTPPKGGGGDGKRPAGRPTLKVVK